MERRGVRKDSRIPKTSLLVREICAEAAIRWRRPARLVGAISGVDASEIERPRSAGIPLNVARIVIDCMARTSTVNHAAWAAPSMDRSVDILPRFGRLDVQLDGVEQAPPPGEKDRRLLLLCIRIRWHIELGYGTSEFSRPCAG